MDGFRTMERAMPSTMVTRRRAAVGVRRVANDTHEGRNRSRQPTLLPYGRRMGDGCVPEPASTTSPSAPPPFACIRNDSYLVVDQPGAVPVVRVDRTVSLDHQSPDRDLILRLTPCHSGGSLHLAWRWVAGTALLVAGCGDAPWTRTLRGPPIGEGAARVPGDRRSARS